eukprot:CAMPEP_0119310326 /NCGR_PEP_ID=MMETSP1333-20130426/18817_1 /TAXON_ID=418940 /ORGANISM="Scyphosphaera apsteinii, Strain RCC1455" /LENGTH=221 /DNA_ID=CAMNT_0007314489 /DNA_START=85 /DNA_END=747 /DNA_ORIENTATION=+
MQQTSRSIILHHSCEMNCIKLIVLSIAIGQATARSAVRQPLSETNKMPPDAPFAQLPRCKTKTCSRSRQLHLSNYAISDIGSLREHWERLPAYEPDANARNTFARDGVTVLRNVIPDKMMLRRLDMSMFEHAHAYQFREYAGTSWLYDAGSRMLATGGARLARASAIVGYHWPHGPRSSTSSQRQWVAIEEAPVWGMNASTYVDVEAANRSVPFHSDTIIS